jgi:phosphate starvation-inducible membrane PsiE
LGEQYRSLNSSLYNSLHSPVTLSLLGLNILLNALFSNTFSLHSSPIVSNQVLHPYKTIGKIMVLYILLFKFLVSKLEDKIFCTEFPDFNLLLISSWRIF